MDQATHNKIVSFIWGIADDVLRDLFKRGKYPDVILPMCVIRRMDAVLEPTKQAVRDQKSQLDNLGITEQRAALCAASGQAFYNTSKFTLRDLKSRGSQQQLLADFEDYLNGFSQNIQDILDNFKFRNQLQTLSKADAIGTLINKFLDPDIDLSPAGIDNHAMDGKDGMHDPRFRVMHNGEELSLVTRSGDVQMLFLANMASRMNGTSPLGSRIAEVRKPGKAKADPLRGLFEATLDGKPAIIEYKPDSNLRDTEQVPLLEEGGIEAFIRREVLPYTPDAWIKADATRIGYEVSFTRNLYKLKSLRTLEEIDVDILAIEKEAEELLGGSPGALMPTANVKAGDVIAMYGNTRSREQRLDH